MADVITRLKVESSEYDAKIKRASQGLLQMEQACRKVGGTLAILEDDEKEFVKSLGQMETVSKTAKGRLNELTQAYTELSLQYKRLTDEEKKGDFGKALSSSLGQLKDRINEARGQLSEVNTELGKASATSGGLSGVLDGLAGKFGLNVSQLGAVGVALGATTAALKVAKDAFFASEENVDEWGRIVDSAKGVYEGFLFALNTGDMSGFLSRIDEIVTAARSAYDELDRLGTLRTIQAPKVSAQQTENERMRAMLRTGRYIAPIDGRKGAMKNGQQLTAEQLKAIEKNLKEGIAKMTTLIENEVKQANRAVTAVYERQSKEIGMTQKEFREGTSSMAEFEKRLEGARKYREWQDKNSFVDQKTGKLVAPRTGNPYEQFRGWETFRVDGERYAELVKLIQERDQTASRAYQQQMQAYTAINRAEGTTVRSIMQGEGGGKSGGGAASQPKTETQINADAIKNLTAQYQELSTAEKTASDIEKAAISERKTAILSEIKALQDRNDELARYAKEATGKTVGPQGRLEAELADLKKKQHDALTTADVIAYGKEIERVTDKIAIFKGELPKDKTAEISIKVDAAQLEKLKEKFQGVQGIDITPKDVEITATDDASPAIEKVQGINIASKDVKITATDDATAVINAVEEKRLFPKDIRVAAIDKATEIIEKLQGESIAPKDVKITATDAATPAIDAINAGEIAPKELDVKIKVTNSDALKEALIATEGLTREVTVQAPQVEVAPEVISTDAISNFVASLKKELSAAEIGSELFTDISAQLADASALGNLIQTAIKNGLDTADFDFKSIGDKILGGDGDIIPDSVWTELEAQINEKLAELNIQPIKLNLDTGSVEKTGDTAKTTGNQFQKAAGAVQSLGAALQNIENPAAKVAGMIAQAIASVAVSFGNALSESKNPWEWIAAAISGTATMISTISAIKSATAGSYAMGGIVPGNSYNGDRLTANVNSGELILNRAQQDNVAAQLTTSREREISLHPYLRGEDLYLGINTYLRRAGKGELAISR